MPNPNIPRIKLPLFIKTCVELLKNEKRLSQKQICTAINEKEVQLTRILNLAKSELQTAVPGVSKESMGDFLNKMIEHYGISVQTDASGDFTPVLGDRPQNEKRSGYFYHYYYWSQEGKVNTDLVWLNEDTKKASLEYYYLEPDVRCVKELHGIMEDSSNTLRIQFGQLTDAVSSNLYFYKGAVKLKDHKVLLGAYVGTRISDQAPIAGACVLHRMSSREEVLEAIEKGLKREEIVEYLQQKRIFIKPQAVFEVEQITRL